MKANQSRLLISGTFLLASCSVGSPAVVSSPSPLGSPAFESLPRQSFPIVEIVAPDTVEEGNSFEIELKYLGKNCIQSVALYEGGPDQKGMVLLQAIAHTFSTPLPALESCQEPGTYRESYTPMGIKEIRIETTQQPAAYPSISRTIKVIPRPPLGK